MGKCENDQRNVEKAHHGDTARCRVILVDVEVSSSRKDRSDTTDCIQQLLLLALPLPLLPAEKAHKRGSASWQDGKKGRQLALLIDYKSPLSLCAFD